MDNKKLWFLIFIITVILLAIFSATFYFSGNKTNATNITLIVAVIFAIGSMLIVVRSTTITPAVTIAVSSIITMTAIIISVIKTEHIYLIVTINVVTSITIAMAAVALTAENKNNNGINKTNIWFAYVVQFLAILGLMKIFI